MTTRDRNAIGRARAFEASDVLALTVLALFTLASVVGYGVFGLHPERLPESRLALDFYAISFQFFAQAHIVVAFVALAVMLTRRSGRRWLPSLAVVAAISFCAEHVGTGYGVPFGGYAYTGLLGPRIGPRVPALIPLSWFLMALPAWLLARSILTERTALRIALGALLLVAWDLALDPAMSDLSPYWIWSSSGPYYGMPWSNLVGWFLTGSAIMTALERTVPAGLTAVRSVPFGVFYGLVLALPLGMLAVAGSWLGVVVTLGFLGTIGLTLGASVGLSNPSRDARSGHPRAVHS